MRKEIDKCLQVLASGGTLIYPTDTIWGLGCDATNAAAVEKVMSIKGRGEGKSFIVLLDTVDRLPDYVQQVPDIAWDLLEMADSPLTIIFPKGIKIAPQVMAHDGSIGIRIVSRGFCHELIRALRKPLVSTSANFSGAPSPHSFAMIPTALIEAVDHMVPQEFETESTPKPSSIIRLGLGGEIELIRK